ncbi:MAG: hypothetical protein Q8M98_08095 [Candidatus Cloacimonadaceae bacterium]|nr:hypothetical protein [Candidatus Cloacimonadaceae bacterium]MDP3114722.1 hypothetical protein [Candidatus Cloacimonadaceae bacterium]
MQRRHVKSNEKKSQVQIEFSEKQITSWAGTAIIISKLAKQIGFRKIIEECIPITETSKNTTGVYSKVISRFISIHRWWFQVFAYQFYGWQHKDLPAVL